MKVCDKCHCVTRDLTQLTDAFDKLELCGSCRDELNSLLDKQLARIAKFRSRLLRRAFEQWKTRDFVHARCKRVMETFWGVIALASTREDLK